VDETGRLRSADEVKGLSDALAGRIHPELEGGSFELARADESAGDGPVLLTQRDIRELQLAKAAIYAGTQVLMEELSVKPQDLESLLLAGAFGAYVRPEQALRIGLLPEVPLSRIRSIGNAAGAGARLVLLDANYEEHAERASLWARYVELAGRDDFQAKFGEAMLFPKPD
jgi:uncharacterized 2Fe-2S/4Fe-4S cluster protein (DUF4445 family)